MPAPWLCAATWGESSTRSSIRRSGLSVGNGSTSNTSNPAPCDGLVLQRCDERFLVDDRPPRGVEEDGGRLHQAELTLAEHVVRLPREDDVERHNVGLPEERIEVDSLDVRVDEAVDGLVGVIGDHADAPGRQHLGKPSADASEADDADGEAGVAVLAPSEVGRGQRRRPPGRAPCFSADVALAGLFQQRQHLLHRGLDDASPVRLGRRVSDDDAELGGDVGIDLVDADGVLCDDAELLRRQHDAAVYASTLDGGADERVGVDGHRGDLLRGVAGRVGPRRLAEGERRNRPPRIAGSSAHLRAQRRRPWVRS